MYSRTVRSNNLRYQTEEEMEELLCEIVPESTEVTAELVECFDENNNTYNEDGYMNITIVINDSEMSENGLYNEIDEELERKLIYPEN